MKSAQSRDKKLVEMEQCEYLRLGGRSVNAEAEEEEEDPGSMEDISSTARSLANTGRYLRPIGERKPSSPPPPSMSPSPFSRSIFSDPNRNLNHKWEIEKENRKFRSRVLFSIFFFFSFFLRE